MKKIAACLMASLLICILPLLLWGCTATQSDKTEPTTNAAAQQEQPAELANEEGDDNDSLEIAAEKTISENGTHTLTGKINGQVKVTAETVTLVLDNVTINSPDGPAILGDDGNGKDAKQNLTVELKGKNSMTAGVKHGIQGKDNLIIQGSGSAEIIAEKDGIHAGDTLTIAGGTVLVKESYEGIEAPHIVVTGGDTTLFASDDGANAATDDHTVRPDFKMSGGKLTIYSGSDGIDSNGDLTVTGGTLAVFINAPQDGNPLDADGTVTVTPTLLVTRQNVSKGTKLTVGKLFSTTLEADATSFSITAAGLGEGQSYDVTADGKTLASGQAVTTVQGMFGGPGMGGGPGGRGGGGGMPPENFDPANKPERGVRPTE